MDDQLEPENETSDATRRREETLDAARRAVDAQRQLAEQQPDAITPGLADSLNTLSGRLAESGRHPEALDAAQEASEGYRALVERLGESFQADLAMSLNNLANRQLVLGHREAAIDSARQAVDYYRQLADSQAQRFTPDLAIALGSLGNILQQDSATAGEAVASFAEGIQRLTPLCLREPDTHGGLLQRLAEHYLGNCLKAGIEPDMELLESFADAFQQHEDEGQERGPE